MEYDFGGYATRNDLKCTDGRIIRKDAFKENNGKKVPLVWGHKHDSVEQILGHAILENRSDGVYAYGKFNKSKRGREAKERVLNGDITSLSIWANNLHQVGPDVLHGVIREVSLVVAGANPGAFIESVIEHGMPMDDGDDEAIIHTNDEIDIHSHAEDDENQNDDEGGEDMTVGEVLDTMTEEQKTAMGIVIDQILNDEADDEEEYDEGDEEEMSHSLFDGGYQGEMMHAVTEEDMAVIMRDAKRLGSFKEAVLEHMQEGGVLEHAIVPMDGMTGPSADTADQSYGFRDPEMLFPEYRAENPVPEFISRNMDWVTNLLGKVKHSPFSRVKSIYADITEDEARAKGYIKGKQKKEEVFTLLKRSTDPQTIYKKQKLDRDDIVDITSFDVVAWIRGEMRIMLNEEIARAILIGDGRAADDEDKIQEQHIRPIATDVDLYTIKVSVPAGADDTESAKNIINSVIRSRKLYKGSGKPTLFTTEDYLTDMLLIEDKIGNKTYKTEAELATALRVSEIVTVEPMEGHKINGADLIGIIVNPNDYRVGTDKGGEINSFEAFDIDFNQHKYLLETRMSGALVKPFSAITLTRGGASTASMRSGGNNYSSVE